jgi:hypothetical protein
MSAFIAPSPHCQAIRWTIYNGGNTIITMWIFVGTLVVKKLIPLKQNKENE